MRGSYKDFLRGKITRENLVRDAPIPFMVIGMAIGMVLMVILFQYYEEAIKSWAGYSWLAFPLLGVYLIFAWILRHVFQLKLSEMLGEKAHFRSGSYRISSRYRCSTPRPPAWHPATPSYPAVFCAGDSLISD